MGNARRLAEPYLASEFRQRESVFLGLREPEAAEAPRTWMRVGKKDFRLGHSVWGTAGTWMTAMSQHRSFKALQRPTTSAATEPLK